MKSDIPLDKSDISDDLFNNSYIAILVVDKNRNNILANDSFCKLFGYSKEEIIGQNTSIFHKSRSAFETFGNIAFRSVIEKKPLSIDFEFKRKDGSYFWAKISGDPLKHEDYILWTLVDITENIETKKKLESISERLNLALEGSNDGLYDWDLKTNALYISPRWKEILGYKDHELENVFKTWEDLIKPEDKAKSWAVLNRYLNDEIKHFEIVFEMKHKDGYYVPIFSRAKKVLDENGETTRIVGTHTDISDIQKIQLELEEQRNLFLTIINETPYPVVLKDYEGKFILVNEATARLYNSTPDEMIGKDDGDYISDKKMAEHFRTNVREIMDSGKTQVVYEDSMDAKTNEVRNFMSIKKPITNKDGEKLILVLANDITDLNKKNRELQEKEKLFFRNSKLAAMGEMIENISHQWRQPLSAISSIATGISIQKEVGILDDEDLKKSMDKINETAQYLSQTIEDFRTFFDKRDCQLNKFKISKAISKALSLVENQFKKYQIKIEKSFEEFELNSFENELVQVLLNILNNANDALSKIDDKKRIIKIKAYESGCFGYIEIVDSANGIDDSIIDKIFDPYFTTKHKSLGTGIGLYMAEEIVAKHLNGEISVENIEFKIDDISFNGAKFQIKIPIS